METKTRDDILLEEKIAKIDDINFDKIYDLEEFASKQISDCCPDLEVEESAETEKCENEVESEKEESENRNSTPIFEIEVSPNEFLDNFNFSSNDEKDENNIESKHKNKTFISIKPLLFTFASIISLLSILLIYNVFVINSLSVNLQNIKNERVVNSNYSSVVEYEEENDYITFENSTNIKIERTNVYQNDDNFLQQTNWFDNFCDYVNKLFGGLS